MTLGRYVRNVYSAMVFGALIVGQALLGSQLIWRTSLRKDEEGMLSPTCEPSVPAATDSNTSTERH
jgi:hypothetical protein